MTFTTAGFVQTASSPLVRRATSTITHHTSLHAKLLDPATAAVCMDFFEGLKTPATLIAGTSFAALFAMANKVQDTSILSKREIIFLRFYHVFSLLSFCLSLTTVLSSQAATTRLLFSHEMPRKVVDVYSFLRASMNTEFLLTRWTFVMSILCFIQSTVFRMIVEFDLFSKRRRTAGVMVVSMMLGVATSLLSFVATSSPGSLIGMTKELGMILWNHINLQRHPLQIASLSLFAIALLSFLKFLLPGTVDKEQFMDHERYI